MKFLHTADLQIGMHAAFAGEACAAKIRAARLRTLKRIVDVANEEAVDFIVIAGDLFEDVAPALTDIGAVTGALREASMPVYVLPGNHDPAEGATPYKAAFWKDLELAGKAFIARKPMQYAVAGGALLLSPCLAKYSAEDPTRSFKEMLSPDGTLRIGVAHGTLQVNDAMSFDRGDQRAGFPIATDAASRAGLSYLALGHWHTYWQYQDGDALIEYCGTPEQTSFADRNCSTVSIVQLAGPRDRPNVKRVDVHELDWHAKQFDLTDEQSLDRGLEALRNISHAERSLVRVQFKGFGGHAMLERLLTADGEFQGRFLYYERTIQLIPRPEDRQQWLELVPVGLARQVATELLDRIEVDGDDVPVATRALELLTEIVR
ncbi:MAG: DNA repair exonuclease [Vulcanimicrobiaceae bacterium]